MFPLQEFIKFTSLLPVKTHPSSSPSSIQHSIISELCPVPLPMAPSSKKMLQTSKQSYPSHPNLGTQTMDLRHQTPKPLISWSDFILYGATILSELSFATHCSRSHAMPPPIHKTPFPSQRYPYLRTLLTHLLLDQFLWHPNQMLPSDTVPMVDMDTDEQQEVW